MALMRLSLFPAQVRRIDHAALLSHSFAHMVYRALEHQLGPKSPVIRHMAHSNTHSARSRPCLLSMIMSAAKDPQPNQSRSREMNQASG